MTDHTASRPVLFAELDAQGVVLPAVNSLPRSIPRLAQSDALQVRQTFAASDKPKWDACRGKNTSREDQRHQAAHDEQRLGEIVARLQDCVVSHRARSRGPMEISPRDLTSILNALEARGPL